MLSLCTSQLVEVDAGGGGHDGGYDSDTEPIVPREASQPRDLDPHPGDPSDPRHAAGGGDGARNSS